MPVSMKHFEERVIAWAKTQPHVRAVIVVGSMARPTGSTTRWSDLDVELICTDINPYLSSETWLDQIGEVWVCLPLWNDGVYPTRLVWFAGGEKVDFSLHRVEDLARRVEADELREEYRRGYRILLDKDGLAARLAPSPFEHPPKPKLTFEEFDFVVREFWYEALHVAQYIRGRNLWVVKFRDATMKHDLLQMMEWHAMARHGWDYDTNRTGKYFAEWTDRETWQAVHTIWGNFDPADSWRALLATLALFGRLADETAGHLGYDYAAARYAAITTYIQNLYAEDDLRYT